MFSNKLKIHLVVASLHFDDIKINHRHVKHYGHFLGASVEVCILVQESGPVNVFIQGRCLVCNEGGSSTYVSFFLKVTRSLRICCIGEAITPYFVLRLSDEPVKILVLKRLIDSHSRVTER